MYRWFILFCLVPCLVFGQEVINRTDSLGRKQGFWCKTDTLGNKVYEGHFTDNIPVGEFRYYYDGGRIKTISVVSDHGICSRIISYYRNGQKMASGKYVAAKKDSIWLFFSETNGNLVAEERYVAGIRDGESKTFHLKGGLAELTTWKMGVRQGKWEQYYSDGHIKFRCFFVNDEKEGRMAAFDPDGRTMIEGQYKCGHQDGIWTYYDEKGIPVKRETYQEGKLIKTEDQLLNTR